MTQIISQIIVNNIGIDFRAGIEGRNNRGDHEMQVKHD